MITNSITPFRIPAAFLALALAAGCADPNMAVLFGEKQPGADGLDEAVLADMVIDASERVAAVDARVAALHSEINGLDSVVMADMVVDTSDRIGAVDAKLNKLQRELAALRNTLPNRAPIEGETLARADATDGDLRTGDVFRRPPQRQKALAPQAPKTETVVSPNAAGVHLVTSHTAPAAELAWSTLKTGFPDLLDGLQPEIMSVTLGADRRTFYRVVAGPLDNRDVARKRCDAFGTRGQFCTPVAFAKTEAIDGAADSAIDTAGL